MNKNFDVIIIGAGPAGYVAAIRCAQLGLSTACVDDWLDADHQPSPGGTCLNVGCIPSKALIESSELFEKGLHQYAAHGINIEGVSLDLATMLASKDKVVRELTQGVAALFMANKIHFISGRGRLLANKRVEVSWLGEDKTETIEAKHIIIATGSSPTSLSVAPFQEDLIVDSTGALAFPEVPKRLGIIGAGVIALELGSVWKRLGSQVFLLKSSHSFLPDADQQVAKEALRLFTQQDLDVRMGAKIEACRVIDDQVELSYRDEQGEHKERLDKLIVAIGRRPNTDNLLGPGTDVELDERGFIQVDNQCRTAAPDVFAVGDVVRGPMLAHKGSEEGVMVAELLAGHFAQVNYDTIPSVIYTSPEIAWVGKTEEQLMAAGADYQVGTFPFSGNGRARAMMQTDGFIKLLADKKTDRLLGAHMIGPQCSELIMQVKIAMDFGSSSEDLAMTMFAHPTLSETLHEAALSVSGRPLHAVQKKKKK